MDSLEREVVNGQTSCSAVVSCKAVVIVSYDRVAVWRPAPPMWILTVCLLAS